jgi:AraC-like DNA-binding protein
MDLAARSSAGKRDRERASSDILGDLRQVLDVHRFEPELKAIATSLGLSVRTLQRRLHDEATSFEQEISVVRVSRAKQLMLDTDWSLTKVAMEAGFSSLARLSVVFRRLNGITPSAWRLAHTRANVERSAVLDER